MVFPLGKNLFYDPPNANARSSFFWLPLPFFLLGLDVTFLAAAVVVAAVTEVGGAVVLPPRVLPQELVGTGFLLLVPPIGMRTVLVLFEFEVDGCCCCFNCCCS